MAIKKLNWQQGPKIIFGPIHKLKAIKRAMNPDWSDQTQHKNAENMYLNS